MAHSVMVEIEVVAHSSLYGIFEDGLENDDALMQSIKVKALWFQRWYYWRNSCGFQEKMIILAWMGLTY